MRRLSSRYVRYLASYAVPGDHICPCLPDTKFARASRLHDSIEMNAKYQVIVSSYEVMGFQVRSCIYRPPLAFQVVRSQYLLLGGFEIAQHAAVECATRARGLACNAAGRSARKSERGLSYLERDADIRDCASW